MLREFFEEKSQLILVIAILLVITLTIGLTLASKKGKEIKLTTPKEEERTFTPEEAGLESFSPTQPLEKEPIEVSDEELNKIIEGTEGGKMESWIEYKDGRTEKRKTSESCNELIRTITNQILEKSFNLSGDVNHDGKVDLRDIAIVDSKINDDKWCQEMLNE